MVPVAHRGLRHLRDQRLRIAKQQVLQRAAALEFIFEHRRAQLVGVTRALHDGAAWRGLTAHEQGYTDQCLRCPPPRSLQNSRSP
jgi:hypothetical protein